MRSLVSVFVILLCSFLLRSSTFCNALMETTLNLSKNYSDDQGEVIPVLSETLKEDEEAEKG